MPDWLLQAFGYFAIAGAIYGGIKADLRAMHERLETLHESANEAHKRIDSILISGR